MEIVVDMQDLCGESPVWDEATQTLYWTDNAGRLFHAFSYKSGQHRLLKSGFQINGFRLNKPGGFLVANDAGACIWSTNGHFKLPIAGPEGMHRLNDCVADVCGRVLSGSVHYTPGGQYQLGALFRIDTDGRAVQIDEGFHLANGLAFSPDGATLYFADTVARRIYAYDYDVNSGNVKRRRVLIQVPTSEGLPDGLVVDAEGFLWSAQWFGSQIVRYDPDGFVERRVSVPAKQVTCIAFGGPDLDQLYITTASQFEEMPELPVRREPNEGVYGGPVYRMRPGVQGRTTQQANIALPSMSLPLVGREGFE